MEKKLYFSTILSHDKSDIFPKTIFSPKFNKNYPKDKNFYYAVIALNAPLHQRWF